MPLHFNVYRPQVCKLFTLPSILIILIALVSSACSEPPQEVVEVIKPVKIYTVGGEGAITLEYPGQVSASTKADMAFEVSGKIVKFPVIAGQNVNKGELLAQLDLRDFQSTFNSAKGEFETAAANFSRAEKLIEDNFISKLDFDKLRSQRSTAKGKFDKAKKSLEDASLRAPFAGQVAMKLVEDFANITAKEPVLILQDVGQLELVVNVPEADWARSKKSDDLTAATKRLTPRVSIAGLPGSDYPAIIKEVSTTADPTTRTYEAKLSFTPNSEVNVLPGMTATLTLTILQQDTGVSIPSKAVVSDNNKQAFVWRIDPDTMMAARTPVKLGNLTGINVIISEGLSSGDLIAVSGVHMLRDNMTVRRFQ